MKKKMQYNNLLKNIHTVKAQSTLTINFLGTKPNYYKITNGGTSDLFLGVTMTPTKKFFDMKIPSQSSRLHVEKHGHDNIYIYNPSTEDANIIVTSFEAEFTPLVFALSDIGQDFSDVNINTSTIITGFETGLPNGNNTIGKVMLDDEMSENLSSIKDTVFNYTPMIMSVRDTLHNKRCTIFRQEKDTTTDITLKMFYIELLSNDSGVDMEIKINNVDFTLKAGEVLNKIQFTRQLNVVIPENSTFRVIGG